MGKPTALRLAALELAKGTPVRVRGADLIAFSPSAVARLTRRIAAGEARNEILSLLATQLVMPKKRSTLVREKIEAMRHNPIDNTWSMDDADRTFCLNELPKIDARDEEGDSSAKKKRTRGTTKKKAARR